MSWAVAICYAGAVNASDEMAAVVEQAVQFILSYEQLKQDYAPSLPQTLHAVEQHIAELRTAIGSSYITSK